LAGVFDESCAASGMACVVRWDADDVAMWLEQCLQLPYGETFKEAAIDGQRLIELDEEHLSTLGVTESAHLLRLLSHISVFRSQLGRSLLVAESAAPANLVEEKAMLLARELAPPPHREIVVADCGIRTSHSSQAAAQVRSQPRTGTRGPRDSLRTSNSPANLRQSAKPVAKSRSHSVDSGITRSARRASAPATEGSSTPRAAQTSRPSRTSSEHGGRPRRPSSADSRRSSLGEASASRLRQQTPRPSQTSARSSAGRARAASADSGLQAWSNSGQPAQRGMERAPRRQARQSTSPSRSHTSSWAMSVASALECTSEMVPLSQPFSGLEDPTPPSAADVPVALLGGHARSNSSACSDSDVRSMSTGRGGKRVGSSPQLSHVPSTCASRRSVNLSSSSSAGRSLASSAGRCSTSSGPRRSVHQAESVHSEFGQDFRRGASFLSAKRDSPCSITPGPGYYAPVRSSSLTERGVTKWGNEARRTMEGMHLCGMASPGVGKYAPPAKAPIKGGTIASAARFRRRSAAEKQCDKTPGPMSYTPRHHFRSGFK